MQAAAARRTFSMARNCSRNCSPATVGNGADVIEQKLQLRVTVCDKGAYPIRIAELDF